MHLEEFNFKLNKNKIQIFLFESTCSIPFSFGVHARFVISDSKGINRWEVGTPFKLGCEKNWGNVYLNKYPALNGMGLFPFMNSFRFKSKLVGILEGDDLSIAGKMRDFIERESPNYQYRNDYSILGPNSNTYVQWVLNNFPEAKFRLSFRAFGKEYKTF